MRWIDRAFKFVMDYPEIPAVVTLAGLLIVVAVHFG